MRWLRLASLRGRLTAGMIVVLIGAGLLVGAVSELSVRHFLIARLDQQLVSAGGRYAATLGPPDGDHSRNGARKSDVDTHGVIPGQSAGTLGIRLVGGKVAQAVVVGNDGDTDTLTLGAANTTAVKGVRPGAAPRGVDLPGVGDYRIRAVRGPDGDIQLTGLPLHPVNQTLLQLFLVEAVFFALLVLLGAVAAGQFVRATLGPLEQLSHTAIEVSTLALTGPTDSLPTTASPTHSSTEVDRVSQALDRMLDRMREAMASRDDTEAQLRRFIADASHELRTPLATIRAHAEYGATGPEAIPVHTADALTGIQTATDRMGTLVADLLLLARLDAGRPLQHGPVDLTRLVLDTVSDARTASPEHRWELDLPEEAVTVDGEEERLRQVLTNLLANAAIHTPPGTTVISTITIAPEQVSVSVTDNGPGVAPKLRPVLFDRFARGDDSRSRAHGSTGLGLAIAQGIARAHHGDLTYQPTPTGGSQFRLTLPR
ncbi:MAG: HAMP domain-containing histidine kinase [Actinomycetota bacterium]|nr:HAMP domain-containing histidine kinase [Actinomycetota bacterium]